MITKFLVAKKTIVRQGPTPMWVRNLVRFNPFTHCALVEVLFCNAVDPFISIRCLFWANLATTFSLSVWKRNEGNPSFIFFSTKQVLQRERGNIQECQSVRDIKLFLICLNRKYLAATSFFTGEWRWRQKFCST